jgi:hypothetical protein
MLTVRLVVKSHWNLNNYRVSHWTSITIDDLEINIPCSGLRHFASLSKMAFKYRSIGAQREFFSKDCINNVFCYLFIEFLVSELKFIHY